MWLRLLLVIGVLTLAGGTLTNRPSAADSDESTAATTDSAAIPPGSVEVPKEIPAITHMHAKLTATQQVLAGLVCEDFSQIAESARELREIAQNVPPHVEGVSDDERAYEHFRHEFVRLAGELERTAGDRNLEGSAYVHGNLTAACIGCHQRLRSSDGGIELLGRR